MRRMLVVVCGLLALSVPSVATADVTQISTGTYQNGDFVPVRYFYATTGTVGGDSKVQGLNVSVSADQTTVTVTTQNAVLATADSSCTVDVLQNRGTCTLPAGFEELRLQGGSESDAISADTSLPIFASVGSGRDTLQLGSGDDTIDYLNDDLPDDVHGGAGTDQLWGTWSGPATLSLDDAANDGPERSNLHSDIENVDAEEYSPSGQPTPPISLIGSAGPNVLHILGGDGDTLRGLGGNDTVGLFGATHSTADGGDGSDIVFDATGWGNTLLGGAGDDRLDARGARGYTGSYADTLDCGSGRDTAIADASMFVSHCETVTPGP